MYRIHNQSTIHKDSDWTSSRAKGILVEAKSVWKNASEECVWRNESEEELLKTRHQKQGHQKHISPEARYVVQDYVQKYIKYSKPYSILCNCLIKSLSVVIEQRKSLSGVIEHRSLLEVSLSKDKSLSCVIEQLVNWDYILVELSLEVQGGQDYFRFVEGTCIIACVLSSSVLYIHPLHIDSELLQTLNLRIVI